MNSEYFKFDATWYHVFTTRCNWNCSYCDFPTKNTKTDVTLENLQNYIFTVKNILKNKNLFENIEFEIEGGEVGLVNQDIIDMWFNSGLSETYQVDTNGKFFEQGYFDKYWSKIHYVIYHCISEFVSADQEFVVYDTEKTDYTVVITKQNFKEFPKLLRKYSNINWVPHFLQPRKKSIDNFLVCEDFLWIFENTKDFSNLSSHIKKRLKLLSDKQYFKSLNRRKYFCANYYRQPLIDLVEQKIYRCCISASGSNVKLTRDNLKKLANNQKLFDTVESMCDNCYNHQVTMGKIDLLRTHFFRKRQ